MDPATIADVGERLLEAYATRVPIPPFDRGAEVGIEDAYGIQLYQVESWLAAGRRIAGFKIGLTSKVMQDQFGVDRPDFGHLFADMVLDGSSRIDSSRFISPRLEPEISFVLRKDVQGPRVTLADVLSSIDYAIASVELIDSRIADWKITLADTIADNASSGALVLGNRMVRIDDIDLGLLGCVLRKNGEVVATGAGGAVLGHPLHAVLFLANTLGGLGRSLPAGSIVMAGAVTAAVPIEAGDVFTATFARLGTVTASFT